MADVDKGYGPAGVALVLAAKTPMAADPGERMLDDPALGRDPGSTGSTSARQSAVAERGLLWRTTPLTGWP